MDITQPSGFSLRVPELMKEKGWNITQFSEAAEISYPTALRFAHGKVSAISLAMLEQLCAVFEVPVGEMVVKDRAEG